MVLIDKQEVLNSIDQYYVWSILVGSFKVKQKNIKSPFRIDNSKGSCVIYAKNNNLIFHDFSTGDHYDLISAIMKLKGLTFNKALEHLLFLNGSCTPVKIVANEKATIKIDPIEWNVNSMGYWIKRGLDIEDMINVYPFHKYYINSTPYYSLIPGYAFKIDDCYKLYFPHKPRPRFISNCGNNTWYFNNNSNQLFICKAFKEYLMIRKILGDVFDYYVLPTESRVDIKPYRWYDKIIIYLDNDKAGIDNADKLKCNMQAYSDNVICIRDRVKDYDEYYLENKDEAVEWLINSSK